MMRVELRKARVDDLPALNRLTATVSKELSVLGTPDDAHMIFPLIRQAVIDQGGVFVAEDHREIVGYCAWVRSPYMKDGLVLGLGTWVHQDYRQTGISRHLREMSRDECRRLGYKYVMGSVWEGNEAGLESALAFGFKPVGTVIRLDLTEV